MFRKISKLFLSLVALVALSSSFFYSSVAAVETSTGSSYNADIAQKLVSRCDLIRDYLTQTTRINELAARQNKVRGWEYILRQLESTGDSYTKLNEDSSNLKAGVSSLKKQLEQFKADFEVYDGAFQRLNAIDCAKQPEIFWRELEGVRTLRTGIALASDNFNLSLDNLLKSEEAKW